MEKRRRKKHQAHKRALVIANEHRAYLATSPGTLDKLDRAVADEAAALTDQENGRLVRDSASSRVDKGRRWLYGAVKLFASVSATVIPAGSSMPFDGARPANDEQLIARVEAIQAAVSADPDTFVKGGITARGLDTLRAQLAAFKNAKDAMTLAGKQHNEAQERFDQAAAQAGGAVDVFEGVLATEPDAPAGALDALRQARRIGPRVTAADEQSAESTAATTPGTTPGTTAAASTTHTPPATSGSQGTTTPPAHDKVA